MPQINFSQAQKTAIVDKIKHYFTNELHQDIGDFDAEFLLDFFTSQVGSFYYNQGLIDAQTALSSQIDHIDEAIDALLKPTDF